MRSPAHGEDTAEESARVGRWGLEERWRGAGCVRNYIGSLCTPNKKREQKKKEAASEKNKNGKITDDKKEAANVKMRRAKIKNQYGETISPGHSAVAILLHSQQRL